MGSVIIYALPQLVHALSEVARITISSPAWILPVQTNVGVPRDGYAPKCDHLQTITFLAFLPQFLSHSLPN